MIQACQPEHLMQATHATLLLVLAASCVSCTSDICVPSCWMYAGHVWMCMPVRCRPSSASEEAEEVHQEQVLVRKDVASLSFESACCKRLAPFGQTEHAATCSWSCSIAFRWHYSHLWALWIYAIDAKARSLLIVATDHASLHACIVPYQADGCRCNSYNHICISTFMHVCRPLDVIQWMLAKDWAGCGCIS